MGTEKRERQKTARFDKIVAEQAAAKRARTKRTVFRAAVGAVVLVAGLFAFTVIMGDDDDGETEAADDTTSTTLPTTTLPEYSNPELANEVLVRAAPDPAPPPAETAVDALEISTLIEGQGDGAAAGDTVVVHYVGKTADGQVFDESWSRGQPFPVESVGSASVITGWNEGLIGAKVGERRRLVIGSDKAYGAQGNDPIPPNAPLAFEIDVVDVVKAGA